MGVLCLHMPECFMPSGEILKNESFDSLALILRKQNIENMMASKFGLVLYWV